MTTNASNMQNHCLLLSNIEFHSFDFTICFHIHKHSVPGQTSTIVIKRQTKSELCPVVQLLWKDIYHLVVTHKRPII